MIVSYVQANCKVLYVVKTSESADIKRGDSGFDMSDLFECHWTIYSPLSFLGIQ